jgi:2-oxoisovalerate dehydrogenase E2 component (dihydrolipoyl transacylase)
VTTTAVVIEAEVVEPEGEAELVAWLTADGALVEVDQPIAEVSTSKAIFEIVAPVAGSLHHAVGAGSVVAAGTEIGSIEHD